MKKFINISDNAELINSKHVLHITCQYDEDTEIHSVVYLLSNGESVHESYGEYADCENRIAQLDALLNGVK